MEESIATTLMMETGNGAPMAAVVIWTMNAVTPSKSDASLCDG